MNARQKLILLQTLQQHMQRKYKFRKNFKTFLLWYLQNFIQNFVLYAMSNRQLRLHRNFWMIDYNQHWFEFMWRLRHSPTISRIFKSEFRVTPETFRIHHTAG